MRKIETGCCALCQIDRVNNETTIEEIKEMLDILTIEKDANVEVGINSGKGQTTVFTIVSIGEDVLERNLIELGFVYIHNFERRKGYNDFSSNPGNLKMYIKNL